MRHSYPFFANWVAFICTVTLCLLPQLARTGAQNPAATAAWGVGVVPYSHAQGDLIDAAVGETHGIALLANGRLVVWGTITNVPPEAQSGISKIAAGGGFNLVLKLDGSVVAWGSKSIVTTNLPGGLNDVVAIAAGNSHALVLRSNGIIVAWGSSSFGSTNIPVGLSNVTAIAAGVAHNLAVTGDGRVISWGGGNVISTNVPAGLTNVIAVAAGTQHSLALRNDGTVLAWGNNSFGETNVPAELKNVTKIAAGSGLSLALKSDETLVNWGAESSNIPVGIGPVFAINAKFGRAIAAFRAESHEITTHPNNASVSEWHPATFSVAAQGFLLSYQWRKNGEIIPGATSTTYSLPVVRLTDSANFDVVVSSPSGDVVSTQVSLTVKPPLPGTVVAWGYDPDGRTAVPLSARGGVVAVSPGYRHILALKEDGTVIAWGQNDFGQTSIPAGLNDVVAVCGGRGSLALLRNGTVAGWATGTNIPPGLSGVKGLAAGWAHYMALKSNGTVVVWGWFSELNPPPGLMGVIKIASGYQHAVALRSDGTVTSWGIDYLGSTNTPAGLDDVIDVAAGDFHSLALRRDGSVVAWGGISPGVPPQAQSGVVGIAGGRGHSVALKRDGVAISWNSATNILAPGIPDLNGMVSVAATREASFAILGIGLRIDLFQTSNTHIIKWPASANGFILQSTADLSPPVSWTHWSGIPTVIGTQFTVTNAIASDRQFFRLVRP